MSEGRWMFRLGLAIAWPWAVAACDNGDSPTATQVDVDTTGSTVQTTGSTVQTTGLTAPTPDPMPEGTTSSMDDVGAAEPYEPWPDVPHPSDDALLACTRTCEGPWDCCPFDAPGQCPSPGYPYNFDCIDGICVANGCRNDDDCLAEDERCLYFDGRPDCVVPCQADASCQDLDPELTCSRESDEGERFCFAHCETNGCGFLACDPVTGRCSCETSGECPVNYDCT